MDVCRRSLARHVKRNHTDHPVFDCSQCGRSFTIPGNLEKHKRNCTGGAPAAKRQCVPVAVPVATTTTAPDSQITWRCLEAICCEYEGSE